MEVFRVFIDGIVGGFIYFLVVLVVKLVKEFEGGGVFGGLFLYCSV